MSARRRVSKEPSKQDGFVGDELDVTSTPTTSEALSARVAAGCLAYVTNKKLPDECVTTVGFGTSVQEFARLDAFKSLEGALDAMKTLNDHLLEIVIVLDCTASMGPSMQIVKDNLQQPSRSRIIIIVV